MSSSSEGLLHRNLHAVVAELSILFREHGKVTEEHLHEFPRIERMRRLRDLSLDELNHWCRFQFRGECPVDDAPGWAIGEVSRTMVFGAVAPMLSILLRDHGPRPLLRVADFGTGTGYRIMKVAADFPETTFRAFEPAPDMFALALLNRLELAPPNLFLEPWDASEAARRFPGHFDLATSLVCAHFSPSLEGHFRDIASSLRRGGILVLREFMISGEFHRKIQEFAAEFLCRAIAMRHAPLFEDDYLGLLARLGFSLVESYEQRDLMVMAGVPRSAIGPRPELGSFMTHLAAEMGVSSREAATVLGSNRVYVLRKD